MVALLACFEGSHFDMQTRGSVIVLESHKESIKFHAVSISFLALEF